MIWYDNKFSDTSIYHEDQCKNCKWYCEDDNGWCEYKAKFVEETDHCDRHQRSRYEI